MEINGRERERENNVDLKKTVDEEEVSRRIGNLDLVIRAQFLATIRDGFAPFGTCHLQVAN